MENNKNKFRSPTEIQILKEKFYFRQNGSRRSSGSAKFLPILIEALSAGSPVMPCYPSRESVFSAIKKLSFTCVTSADAID